MAFSKGQSGNPNGRPHGSVSQKTLLKSRAQEAVATLEALMHNPATDPEIRIMAASALLSAHFQQQSVN